MAHEDLRENIKERYGAAVTEVLKGQASSCCGSSSSCAETGSTARDPITRDLYTAGETQGLPPEALLASFGCGNPTALAELHAGEVVLDLGSGGGIDVLLSARRVGPAGKAYGLDMTPKMLELARTNQRKARVTNAEFLTGTIESVPLPDDSVDVVISNCVINLSGDKPKVFAEAFRVLRPGGRFAVSDVVLRRELPPAVQSSMQLWTGCVSGALLERDYVEQLTAAGFADVSIEPTRIFGRDDVQSMACAVTDTPQDQAVEALQGAVMSAFIRARKP